MFLVWIGGLVGCSDSTGNNKENTNTVVGFWFACEFGSSNDCMILDDDGYQFTTDGEIYDIEEVTQGSEPECGQSPCFRSDQRSITVYRQLIGTYTYDDNSLEIVLDSDIMPACTENVIWNTNDDFFGKYFFRIAGNKTLENQIISGLSEEEIRLSWKNDIKSYKKMRKKYLLYKDFE